eukprot:gene17382-22930_t
MSKLRSKLLQSVLNRIESVGLSDINHFNLIAFSGGVDSSVVAASVYRVYPNNSQCIIGRSTSLPDSQLILARDISKYIGIPLKEVETKESESSMYIANEGMSCYSCKSHLYTALNDIYDSISLSSDNIIDHNNQRRGIIIFNGTNFDDLKDKTRVGLQAAREFKVASPIDHLTKNEVREVAYELGLPNHNFAASPCLRSRLAFGVKATNDNMKRIELAEYMVRQIIKLDVSNNMRVRHMNDGSAQLELDKELIEMRLEVIHEAVEAIAGLGFKSVRIMPFRSGGISTNISTTNINKSNINILQ